MAWSCAVHFENPCWIKVGFFAPLEQQLYFTLIRKSELRNDCCFSFSLSLSVCGVVLAMHGRSTWTGNEMDEVHFYLFLSNMCTDYGAPHGYESWYMYIIIYIYMMCWMCILTHIVVDVRILYTLLDVSFTYIYIYSVNLQCDAWKLHDIVFN